MKTMNIGYKSLRTRILWKTSSFSKIEKKTKRKTRSENTPLLSQLMFRVVEEREIYSTKWAVRAMQNTKTHEEAAVLCREMRQRLHRPGVCLGNSFPIWDTKHQTSIPTTTRNEHSLCCSSQSKTSPEQLWKNGSHWRSHASWRELPDPCRSCKPWEIDATKTFTQGFGKRENQNSIRPNQSLTLLYCWGRVSFLSLVHSCTSLFLCLAVFVILNDVESLRRASVLQFMK